MLKADHTNSIAVFIDAENLVAETEKAGVPFRIKSIVDRIREEGRIASIRAYGDWSRPPLSKYVDEFKSNVIEMIQLSTSTEGKNTADIQLALDALEMALQPSSPNVFIMISGDRDFVPLAQKIKRYGKFAVGIGYSETSTSKLLAGACDLFLFANEILDKTLSAGMPSRASESAPTVSAEGVSGVERINRKLRKAFTLLAKAIAACERHGLPASSLAVQVRIRQLDSTFYPGRYGFATFRDFAVAAEKAGYARIIDGRDTDSMTFDATFVVDAELVGDELVDYDYSTVEDAVESYRDILRTYKKLEILPWADRKRFVERAWECLSKAPMTYDELIGELELYAAANLDYIPDKAIELLVRTLSIASCFTSDDGVAHFYNLKCHVKPAVSLEEALHLMNYTYLNGIKISVPDVKFVVDAVAILLFDEATDETREQASRLIREIVGTEPEETALGLALKKAGVSKEEAEEGDSEQKCDASLASSDEQ
ncbi:MAG: NYN domain-containing protein [Armatimonadota bacterium]